MEGITVWRGAAVLLAGTALLVAGCSSSGESEPPEPVPVASPTPTATVTDDDETDNSTATPDADDDDDAGGVASGRIPAQGECVDVSTPASGRYQVYKAGSAVVRRQGDRLVVGGVSPASGWTARVTESGGDDDVVIEFRRKGGPLVLQLEVELDDGRVEAQICSDTRDDDDNDDRDDRND